MFKARGSGLAGTQEPASCAGGRENPIARAPRVDRTVSVSDENIIFILALLYNDCHGQRVHYIWHMLSTCAKVTHFFHFLINWKVTNLKVMHVL